MKSRTFLLYFTCLLVACERSEQALAKERSPRLKARGAAIEQTRHNPNIHKKKTAYSYST